MDDRRNADLDQILSIFLNSSNTNSWTELSCRLSVVIWAKCTKELNKNSKRQCWWLGSVCFLALLVPDPDSKLRGADPGFLVRYTDPLDRATDPDPLGFVATSLLSFILFLYKWKVEAFLPVLASRSAWSGGNITAARFMVLFTCSCTFHKINGIKLSHSWTSKFSYGLEADNWSLEALEKPFCFTVSAVDTICKWCRMDSLYNIWYSSCESATNELWLLFVFFK